MCSATWTTPWRSAKKSAKPISPSKIAGDSAIATTSKPTSTRRRLNALIAGLGLATAAAIAATAGIVTSGCAPAPQPAKTPVHRLAKESSPYLREHADNVVDWYPWGEEAFAKAKAENKPVFLSVGYSTCHWCHVMEEESFMNPEVGRLLNEAFVPIKVDRETRPDIDRLYMGFLLATTGNGGWPMSVFLTPEAQPFLAGTYYPQPAKYGRIGFLDLLKQIQERWQKDPADIIKSAGSMAAELEQASQRRAASTLPDKKLLTQALIDYESSFDPKRGGFSAAPKFPQPVVLSLLLANGALKDQNPESALTTLEAMARGGINDQLEGGFHRYSTDEDWRVPHFEKMLSDQALLLDVYSRAYALTGKPIFADTANSIASYLHRKMTLENGGLASAEDADSLPSATSKKPKEGAFYVWTEAEMAKILTPEEMSRARKMFGTTAKGNASGGPLGELDGENVLTRAVTSARADATIEDKLRSARDRRPRPHRDEKALAAWNAMAANALAEASIALHSPEYLQRATSLLEFLETSLVTKGRLNRSYFEGRAEVDAFAQDYAELVAAYLSTYAATGDPHHLARAVHWQERQEALFADAKEGGYFETEANAKNALLFRDKELQDGATWSTASRSALNLLTLHRLTGKPGYRDTFERLLKSVGPNLEENPQSLPGVLMALDLSISNEQTAVIVGQRPEWSRLLKAGYHPERTLLTLSTPENATSLKDIVAAEYVSLPSDDAVYFCENFTCGRPITSTAELQRRLAREGRK